jgi:hypothetical protein
MNFYGQLNMFFGKIISYTCDIYMELIFLT